MTKLGARFLMPLLLTSLIIALAGSYMQLAGNMDGAHGTGMTFDKVVIFSSDPAINVYQNDQFASVPGITGNGSAGNPYIIKDKVINANGTGSAISIGYTDAYLIIQHCTVSNASGAGNDAGIMLDHVMNANVSHNVVVNNPQGIAMVHSSHVLVSQNNVSKSNLYGIYALLCSNITISGNNASQAVDRGIYLFSSTNNTVSGNNVWENDYGISLSSSGSTKNIFSGNNASDNTIGIEIYGGNDNNVTGNIVTDNGRGIQLFQSSFNNITGNEVVLNSESGMYFFESNNNSVSANNLTLNSIGIELATSCHNNTISGNNASNNTANGISLSWSNDNTISGNNASNNTAKGISMSSSSNNKVYSNIFIKNTGGWIQISSGSGNIGYDNLCSLGQVESLVVTPGVGQMTLNWVAPDGGWSRVSLYRIYRASIYAGVYGLVGTNDTITGFADTGLTNGQDCYYKVAALNGLGEGTNSSVHWATTWDVPGQVSNLVATSGDGRVTLSWSPPEGGEGEVDDGGSPITGYNVYWTTDNVTYNKIVLGDVTSYVHLGRTNGQAYHYRVSAVNALGEGSNSTAASATPKAAPPATDPGVPGYDLWIVLLASAAAVMAVAALRRHPRASAT